MRVQEHSTARGILKPRLETISLHDKVLAFSPVHHGVHAQPSSLRTARDADSQAIACIMFVLPVLQLTL